MSEQPTVTLPDGTTHPASAAVAAAAAWFRSATPDERKDFLYLLGYDLADPVNDKTWYVHPNNDPIPPTLRPTSGRSRAVESETDDT